MKSLFLALFLIATSASASSYTIFDLGTDESSGLYAITASGEVVVWRITGCGIGSFYCYDTYADGVSLQSVVVPPPLIYDDGTACASGLAGFNTLRSVCNGSLEAIATRYNPNNDPAGIYLGSTFLRGGTADQMFLNSAGDLAWTDGESEEIFVAMLNTPQPQFHALFSGPISDVPEPSLVFLLILFTGWLMMRGRRLCTTSSAR